MATVRRCPKCFEPLQSTRHRKLRCPKCKTLYPLTPETPDFLHMPLVKWLRLIRWASLGIAALIVLLSTNFFTRSGSAAADSFWLNTALVIVYATGAYSFLHLYMYVRNMERTLWVGTGLDEFSHRERRTYLFWVVFYMLAASATMLGLLRDSVGQVAALNALALAAAFVAHLAVQAWSQHAGPIFEGIATSFVVDALKRWSRRKKAPTPARKADK